MAALHEKELLAVARPDDRKAARRSDRGRRRRCALEGRDALLPGLPPWPPASPASTGRRTGQGPGAARREPRRSCPGRWLSRLIESESFDDHSPPYPPHPTPPSTLLSLPPPPSRTGGTHHTPPPNPRSTTPSIPPLSSAPNHSGPPLPRRVGAGYWRWVTRHAPCRRHYTLRVKGYATSSRFRRISRGRPEDPRQNAHGFSSAVHRPDDMGGEGTIQHALR